MDINHSPENETYQRRKEGKKKKGREGGMEGRGVREEWREGGKKGRGLLTDPILLAPGALQLALDLPPPTVTTPLPFSLSPSALERHCSCVGGWSDKWVDRQTEEGVSFLGFL